MPLIHLSLGYLSDILDSQAIFKLILVIDSVDIYSEIASRWMSQDATDVNSALQEILYWHFPSEKKQSGQNLVLFRTLCLE